MGGAGISDQAHLGRSINIASLVLRYHFWRGNLHLRYSAVFPYLDTHTEHRFIIVQTNRSRDLTIHTELYMSLNTP